MGVEVYLSFFLFYSCLKYECNRMVMTDQEVDLCRSMVIAQPLPALRLPSKLRTATQPKSIASVVSRDGISTSLSWNECIRID